MTYPPFWFKAVADFHKTKTLSFLMTSLIVVALYVFVIVYVEQEIFHIDFKPSSTIFSLLGLVLGLLLVFRTNTAYDRWWEGRRMLGALVNNARNLALKFNAYLPKSDFENRNFYVSMIGNYGIAMKEHLRDGVLWDELDEIEAQYLNQLMSAKHVPNKIAGLMYEKTNQLYIDGIFTAEQFLVLDKQIESFTDVVGACERIKNTPIPFSYSVHLKKFLFFYIGLLPFALIHDMGYWSIPVMVLVFYAFAGLEVIGEEIEDPFGKDVNDLPTDKISINININVKEILLQSPTNN